MERAQPVGYMTVGGGSGICCWEEEGGGGRGCMPR